MTVIPEDLPYQNGGLKSQNHSNAVKKSRENERRRRRRKQKKNKASQGTTAFGDDSDTAAENSNGIVNDSFKKDSDAQKALEQVEVEYVPEKAELDDDLNEEFRKVFEKFSFSEGE